MRWIIRGLLVVVGIVAVAIVVLYGASEYVIRKGHAVPLTQIAVPADAASIAEGARLARITGCSDCHGDRGQGRVFVDDPMFGRVAPPALTRVATNYTNPELVRAIRHGVRKDGSSLFVMPTGALGHLSDDDVGKVIAWVRSLKLQPGDSTLGTSFGPIARAMLLAGKVPKSATPQTVSTATRPTAIGRYFVEVSCNGCHALHSERLSDDGRQTVPPLAMVSGSYDLVKFKHLLKTGEGMSKRDLGLMSEAARGGLNSLTDAEVEAIHAYLKMEAAKAPTK
ncbi:c-type cytochrome [Sphingomonas sp. M1-B02]|uniref:c-type cytochrome n=1 Tax=Sphingomonas sp. M1-B02 TaxID=3114300 RepID=UPI00223F152B|nr:c-type cytochrome [Sphingomonas sp. S6-11]UZK66163.1 c-type cytochrome [Sphingomonas sp. S6-11]